MRAKVVRAWEGFYTPPTVLAAFTHNQARDCEPDKVGLRVLLHDRSSYPPQQLPALSQLAALCWWGIFLTSATQSNSFGCALRLQVHTRNCTKQKKKIVNSPSILTIACFKASILWVESEQLHPCLTQRCAWRAVRGSWLIHEGNWSISVCWGVALMWSIHPLVDGDLTSQYNNMYTDSLFFDSLSSLLYPEFPFIL